VINCLDQLLILTFMYCINDEADYDYFYSVDIVVLNMLSLYFI